MAELVDFVDALAKSIFALTLAGYLRDRHVKSGDAKRLQLREGPYKNGSVVVVERPSQRLYVGQPVFTLIESAGARWGRILEIRLDGVSTSSVDDSITVTDVGLSLSFRCPSSVVLYVLDDDDEVGWSPLPGPVDTAATSPVIQPEMESGQDSVLRS